MQDYKSYKSDSDIDFLSHLHAHTSGKENDKWNILG